MRFTQDHFKPLANTYQKIRVKETINPKELKKENGKFIRDERLIAYCFQCFGIAEWLYRGKIVWAERPIEHFSTETNFKKFHSDEKWFLGKGMAGKEAGSIEGNYRRVSLHGDKIYVHEIAFAMANGRWKTEGMEIHHINGNSLDNRPWNLKEVSPQENIRLRDDGNTKEALQEVLDERVAHPSDKLDRNFLKIDMAMVKIADDEGRCPIWRLSGIEADLSKKIAEKVQWHGGPMDPIQVVKDDDGKYFIADGYSRYNAAIELGYDAIDAVEIQRFDGMSAFDTAQAVSARNNAHIRAKANDGWNNMMILWKKSCEGSVDIENLTYKQIANRFKMSPKKIKEIKTVWKWFKDDADRIKSGNWNIDSKMDESANMPALDRAQFLEETMRTVESQLKKIPELERIVKDKSLFIQLFAKTFDIDFVEIADEVYKMEKDQSHKLRKKVKEIESPLDFEG